jgi:hypothetical protein
MNPRLDDHDERERPADADARLIRILRENYGPAPSPPARAAAFDEELRRRVRVRSRGSLLWAPAAAFATVAILALAFAVRVDPLTTEPMTGSTTAAGATAEERAAALDDADFALLFPQDVDYGQESARTDLLPDDYVAIASELLLEG